MTAALALAWILAAVPLPVGTIDRVEGDYAVVETPSGAYVDVPVVALVAPAEGSPALLR